LLNQTTFENANPPQYLCILDTPESTTRRIVQLPLHSNPFELLNRWDNWRVVMGQSWYNWIDPFHVTSGSKTDFVYNPKFLVLPPLEIAAPEPKPPSAGHLSNT